MNLLSILIIIFGFILLLLGFISWTMQKLLFINGFNYRKVRSENVKPYTRIMGIAYIILGVSMILYALMGCFEALALAGTILWCIGFITTLIIIIQSQRKYNTGIFRS